jgi:hypothetical protein
MRTERTGLGMALAWGLAALVVAGPSLAQGQTGFARWTVERQALANDPAVVAYYDFQEGLGRVLKNHAHTGPALDGKIEGATWTMGRWPAKRALEFDGKTSLVEIPASPLLVPLDTAQGGTGEMTLEVWVRVTDRREAGVVDPSSGGTAGEAPYGLWISPTRYLAFLGRRADGSDSVAIANDTSEAPLGEWTPLVVTVTATTLTLYRGGVPVSQAPRAFVPVANARPLLIGAMGRLDGGRFRLCGVVDEVIIYNRALTPEQVAARATLLPEFWTEASLVPPGVTLKLLEPKGGGAWDAGSKHYLRWDARGPWVDVPLTLEYSADGGRQWTPIGTAASRLGKFLWTVPDVPAKRCKVRVSAPHRLLSAQSAAVFAVTPSRAVPEYQWVQVLMPGPFAPRDGAGALTYQGKMWLIGGWNPADKAHFPRVCNNEVWSSADGANWTLVHPNTFLDQTFDPKADWEGRHTAGYVVHRGKMWIVGGDPIQGHYQSDVWNSADGKTWTCVTTEAPWGPRVLQYTVAFKDRIWVIGGQTLPPYGPAEERFYRDIWASSDGLKWDQIKPLEPFWPQRGMIGGRAVFKGRLWLLGGGTYDTPQEPRRKFFNDVWSTADGVHWQCHLANAPWEPRQYHDVAVFDGKLWVLEGFQGANRNDVWYSPDGSNWYEVPNTPWAPRHASSAFVHDGALWLVVGNNMESDVWKLVRAPRKAP